MQGLIQVDKEKCVKDGFCVADCPARILKQDEDGYPVAIENAETYCLDCGHCVAVCPSSALDQRRMAAADCAVIRPSLGIRAEQLEHYLLARRSIRQYRQKPVDREAIEKLLYIAGFAPSGHNTQPTQWTVITSAQEVAKLAGLVVAWMRAMLVDEPEIAAMLHFERIIAAWDQGIDRIMRGAPHLVIAHAPQEERTAPLAIATAIAHLELAAPALGVGTCWAGYFFGACQSYAPIQAELSLPEGHAVFGAVMLGYPKARYHRIPLRKPPDVIWR